MMNFNDLRLTNKKEAIFLPSNLRCKLSEVLAEKRPDIEQASIGRMSIIPGSEIYKQRNAFYEKYKDKFSDSIYEKDYPVERYEAFISRIEPEQIFEKVKYFYLGKEDKEFLRCDTKSSQSCLTKVSESDGDIVVLPLDCSKFAAVGDFETLEKFNFLINEKELTEPDIELIFSAIRLKKPGSEKAGNQDWR